MSRPCPPGAGRPAPLGVAALTSVLLLTACSPIPPVSRGPGATPATQGAATTGPAATQEPMTQAPGQAATTGGSGATSPGRPRTPTPTASESTELADAVIAPDGLGPIRIGMSLAEARARGWAARSQVCDKWDASPDLADKGVSLTFVNNRLYELWVHEPGFATEAGIQVGDTLTDARDAYGNQLRTEFRDGGGGRLPAWFVVDGTHELLFVEQDPGQDEQIKSILARTHGTDVIEGC